MQAAADIQRHVLAHSHGAAEKLRVRIGIHAGEPVVHHNDLFGRTVQLAARLCSEADPGAVDVKGRHYSVAGVLDLSPAVRREPAPDEAVVHADYLAGRFRAAVASPPRPRPSDPHSMLRRR